MKAFINFFKNILSINSDDTYIGLSGFSNTEDTLYEKPQQKRKEKELTLSELLRRG